MKGVYTITKYKAERDENGEWICGELIEVLPPQENRITQRFAKQIMEQDVSGRGPTQVLIKVSEAVYNGAALIEGNSVTTPPHVAGTVNTNFNGGSARYTAAAGLDDAFWEVNSLIAPPAPAPLTRYIRTVYMGGGGTQAQEDVFSILNLTTPCPQTDSEILEINYKLILDSTTLDAEGTTGSRVNDERFQFLFPGSSYYMPSAIYVQSIGEERWGVGIKELASGKAPGINSGTEIFYNTVLGFGGDTAIETLQKQGFVSSSLVGQFGISNISTNSSEWCGYPLKGLAVGQTNRTWTLTNVDKGTPSSVQNTFAKSADTGARRKPFLNTGDLSTSAASVTMLDKGWWKDHIVDSYTQPFWYKIEMVTGGIVGTATYKVKRRRLGRWDNNSEFMYPLGIGIPNMEFLHNQGVSEHMDKTTASTTRHGQTIWNAGLTDNTQQDPFMNNPSTGYTGYLVQRYNYPEFITFDYTGLTICDINVLHVNIDATTTPALNVTEVLQIDSDGSDIYVADAATGLHKIERNIGDFNASNFTITQLTPPGITDATSCRGVTSKGGGYNGHPGKIVEVRIIQAGYGYAVSDAITFAGANGTSAAATVNTIDANGGVTSIRITNKGSGYLEDNVQAYISNTLGGAGVKLEPVIGSGGDIWALFDDATDGFMYLAHATRIIDNSTNINFNTTGDTITGSGGTNFHTAGFVVGMKLIIKNAEDAGNNGTFTISAMNTNGLEMTVSENLTTNATDTTAQIEGVKWEIMTEVISTTETLAYTANGVGVGDTIAGSGTSFITQGFRAGMEIVISASTSNNGTYTIASINGPGTVITLIPSDVLVTETFSDTMETLTDFTIAGFTDNVTQGRDGFIGLIIDPEHADDRFAMLTANNKVINNGSTTVNTTDGGWDWWSFANSTGTTTAGTTDRIRTASNIDNQATGVEQFAPSVLGPISETDIWVVSGESDTDMGYNTWGSATVTVTRSVGQMRKYGPMRNTDFAITIGCVGTASNQEWRTCDTVAQMNTPTTSDTILCYDFGVVDNTNCSPANMFRKGVPFGYLGKGFFWNITNVQNPYGFYIWTGNGDGLLANEEALPLGFWEEYGWDGNDWVLGNASAKTTHAEVAFVGSNLNFNVAGTVVGTFTGTDWATDGFIVGDHITITGSANGGENDGIHTIKSLSTTTLTITEDTTFVTNATDVTAAVVGSHALIDGLAISFDDNGGAAALVLNEYYTIHLFDGILKDNATRVTMDLRYAWAADATGTDFSTRATDSATTIIPASNIGPVTNIPLMALYYRDGTINDQQHYVEPGIAGQGKNNNNVLGLPFNHQIPQSTNFVLRFKAAGCWGSVAGIKELHMGLCPWTDIVDGTQNIAIAELDENIKIEYDLNFLEIDQYVVRVRNTGNGADQLVYAADRVQVVVGQVETDYNGGAGEGQFIDGAGYANGDIITMDDGSTVTVVTQTGGQVTTFNVTTASLKSSGRTERNVVGTYTTLDFQNTGSTITRTGGSGFIVDGFLVGMKLIVDASTNNDGVYTITSVADTVIIVAEALVTNASENPGYFGTGLSQVSVSPGGGSGFALPMGTANETAVTAALGGKDEFSMHRIGTGAGNTTWRLNGVVFYTYAGALHTATDMGVVYHQDVGEYTNIYDASIDYTINQRMLQVGNGTTTGTNDPNFRCLPNLLAGTNKLRLYHDTGGTPVEFVYITDTYTVPAAGEVSILPYSGDLWFNTAQGGSTITGNWTITKRPNLT